MALFQKTVIDKYLSKLNEAEVKKAFGVLKNEFSPSRQQRILTVSEIAFQGEFIEKLFDKVLGYVRFDADNWNIKREQNSETSEERADAAIMIDCNENHILAVIELKSTKTHSLQSVEGQVFKYFRQHQPVCRYAVISNFQMIRLYVDDNQGFEQFDIFKIVNDDRFDLFRLLYLYLNPQFVFQNLPAKIREGTIQKEKEITNNLYRLYSDFRFALHKELHKQNPKIDELLLFKKTQKLIDRFLFIFFAEDKGLLPTRTIQKHIAEWSKNSKISLFESFKTLFKDLKDGNKAKDIFAYNGGLFDTDSVLDSAKLDIGNSLEVYLNALQGYDFKTEVDVNILGHIFEQSLNDMDEMKALTEGKKIEKGNTKRKKEGVFYTPQYITRYIVENTIGVLCREKEQELGIIEGKEVTKKQLNAYSQWLSTVKVLDPACGSGAFLNQALSFFISQYERIDERMAGIDGKPVIYGDYDKYGDTILKNNIFGVDLNEEAVEIAKLSLWLRTAKEGKKLISLNDNIKVGNSLIDNPSVSDAPFNWKKAFPEVFKQGGFDVVIGNPPYVRAEYLTSIRAYLQQNYTVFQPASDLFAYFYEKSFKVLKPNGLLGFISNTFEKTTSGRELRKYLKEKTQFLKYVDFTEVIVFEGATTYPVIIVAQNAPPQYPTFQFIKIPKSSQATIIDINSHKPDTIAQSSLDDANWSFKSSNAPNVVSKIIKHPSVLETFGKCYRGLITGLNEAFIVPNQFEKSEHVKLIYEGYELKKWHVPTATQQLIAFKSKWTKGKYGKDVTEKEALQYLKKDFPKLMQQLLPFEEKAKQRYDKGDFWWELRNCAYYDLFEKPKIVFPNLQNSNKFAFDDKATFINAPAVFLPTNDKALLGVLNSKLVWYFLKSICVVRSGGYIEVKPQYFEQIPIAKYTAEQKKAITFKVDTMIKETAELQSIVNGLLAWAQKRFPTLTLKKAMETWYDMDWKAFDNELKKQKCLLLPKELTEWASYFEKERQKAKTIVKKLADTDREIDGLVYGLYGLTKAEIAIIEQG